jgi:hypothetical protein
MFRTIAAHLAFAGMFLALVVVTLFEVASGTHQASPDR